jgi:hypothetical protein
MLLKIILLSIVLVGIAVAGIAIKMIFKKNGRFEKSCSVKDPKTGESLGCSCNTPDGESCHNTPGLP